jgi:hypothetical protein
MPLRCCFVATQNFFKFSNFIKMKSLKIFLVATLLLATSLVQAQVSPVFFRTVDNRNYNFSYEGTYRTTDSTTYHTVGTLSIAANEVGILEVEVIGIDTTSTGGFVVGKQMVNYSKLAGTLTISSATNVLTPTTSVSLITSAFRTIASSNSIVVQVKGTINRDILWTVRIKPIRRIKPS